MSKEILFKDLCYEIVGLCFKVQKNLGRFCKEKQYCDDFEKLLEKNNIRYQREFALDKLENNDIRGNRVDFFIENSILVDFKAKKFITKDDYNQMQRYLQCSDIKLGLLVNFRETYLKPKRVINHKYDKLHTS